MAGEPRAQGAQGCSPAGAPRPRGPAGTGWQDQVAAPLLRLVRHLVELLPLVPKFSPQVSAAACVHLLSECPHDLTVKAKSQTWSSLIHPPPGPPQAAYMYCLWVVHFVLRLLHWVPSHLSQGTIALTCTALGATLTFCTRCHQPSR